MAAQQTVLVFATTHEVLRADEALQQASISHEVIPKPRGIAADCGVVVAVRPELQSAALAALEAVGMRPDGVYSHFPLAPAGRRGSS